MKKKLVKARSIPYDRRKESKMDKVKTKAKTKLTLVNFKASAAEKALLKKVAEVYTNGNVGGLIRQLADPRLLKSNRIRLKRAA